MNLVCDLVDRAPKETLFAAEAGPLAWRSRRTWPISRRAMTRAVCLRSTSGGFSLASFGEGTSEADTHIIAPFRPQP